MGSHQSHQPPYNEPVIDKNRYSVFLGTSLDETWNRKIEGLIITGVMTNCCCETTARDDFLKDYRYFSCHCDSYDE